MSSSSSDSDAGERIKNVRSFLIKSKMGQEEATGDYAYKQKLGDLIFDANYEGANLGHVEQIDLYEYDLMLRPDIANLRHRLWFNFTVSNQQTNQCVIFNFVNLSDELRLFHEGLTPVARSRLNPNWVRLHEDQVFYYKSSNHGDRYVLSLAFRFSDYDNEHQFALFYPYTYTNLIGLISRWAVELKRNEINRLNETTHQPLNRKSPEYMFTRKSPVSPTDRGDRQACSCSPGGIRKLVCREQQYHGEDVKFEAKVLLKTILSKSLYLLSIKGVGSDGLRPTAVILCRFCGNIDSATSFVSQGLVDYLLCEQPLTRVARQCMDVLVFPIINPDSICIGNSRTDIMGQMRIPRKIFESNKGIYSNLATILKVIKRTCHHRRRRVVLIELDVNFDLIGSRISGSHYDDSLRMERHLLFPRLMARFANDFYMENCEFADQEDTVSLLGNFGKEPNVDQYRMEVSPFAFYKRCLMEKSYEEYDQLKYLALGKAMVYALFELFRAKDIMISADVKSTLDSFQPKSEDIDNLVLYFNSAVELNRLRSD